MKRGMSRGGKESDDEDGDLDGDDPRYPMSKCHVRSAVLMLRLECMAVATPHPPSLFGGIPHPSNLLPTSLRSYSRVK